VSVNGEIMAQPGEKNISAFINQQVSEDFKNQCEKRGFIKYKAIEGALRLWLTLSQQEQVELIEGISKHKDKMDSDDDIMDDLDRLAREVAAIKSRIFIYKQKS
jgi:hypothetical protein